MTQEVLNAHSGVFVADEAQITNSIREAFPGANFNARFAAANPCSFLFSLEQVNASK
jgi:hypothetical protein